MEFISDKVDAIYTQRRGGDTKTAESHLAATIQRFNNYTPFNLSPRISTAISNQPPLPGSQIQRSQLDHIFTQASDFDARLTQLEQSLGLPWYSKPTSSLSLNRSKSMTKVRDIPKRRLQVQFHRAH